MRGALSKYTRLECDANENHAYVYSTPVVRYPRSHSADALVHMHMVMHCYYITIRHIIDLTLLTLNYDQVHIYQVYSVGVLI